MQAIYTWLEGLSGLQGALLFITSYIVTCVFLLPGFILTYAAGFIFGYPLGVLMVLLGASLGAISGFLVARNLGQKPKEWLYRKFPRSREIATIVEAGGWKSIALLRLCPVFPFRLSNYALGCSDVRFVDFVKGTMLGIVPGALVYVYLGTLIPRLADVPRILRSQKGLTLTIPLYVLGAVSALVLLYYLGKLSERKLRAAKDI